MGSSVDTAGRRAVFATPPVDWAPTSRMQWTALCMSGALAGSAWLVAGSIPDRR